MSLASLAINAFTSIWTSLLLGALTLLLGLVLGQLIGKITLLILNQFDLNNALNSAGIKIPAEQMIASSVTYAIYILFFIFTLSVLGISTHIANIIGVVLLALIMIYILLGLGSFIPNAYAGMVLSQRRIIRKGQTITTANITGIVREMSLTETRLHTKQGDMISIPNSRLINEPVVIKHETKKNA